MGRYRKGRPAFVVELHVARDSWRLELCRVYVEEVILA